MATMQLVLLALSTVIAISAGLSLKPSPRRDITFPRHVQLPDPDAERDVPAPVKVRKGDERPMMTKVVHQVDDAMEARVVRKGEQGPLEMTQPIDGNPARLRVSDSRRKKVKQVSSTRENETTRVSTKERKLHTKVVHVPEPFVVHVEKPYPVYIEKPVIVEKHLPMHLYITKKETKHH